MINKTFAQPVAVLTRHRFVVKHADFGHFEFSKARGGLTTKGTLNRTAQGWVFDLVSKEPNNAIKHLSGTEPELLMAVCKVCLLEGDW